jgi:hypothetical protein
MYLQLINYYVKEKYTLRYTGGMVPDVNQVSITKSLACWNSNSHPYKTTQKIPTPQNPFTWITITCMVIRNAITVAQEYTFKN